MLYNQANVVYGPGAKLDASEPTSVIVASYGPTKREREHTFFVRRVSVQPMRRIDTPNGFTWCRFPGGRDMLVSDYNIHARRDKPQGEEKEAA